MNKSELVAVRAFHKNDENFIYATFLRGLYHGDIWFREMDKSVFLNEYRRVVERLITAPTTVIQVACLKADPEVILGYSILGANPTGVSLHWIFVKTAWRGIGIAKSLVPSERLNACTHLSKVGLSILRKHQGVSFNPFLIP